MGGLIFGVDEGMCDQNESSLVGRRKEIAAARLVRVRLGEKSGRDQSTCVLGLLLKQFP
jgi:hypothetical protein